MAENANKNEQPQEEVIVESNNNKKMTTGKKILIWVGGALVLAGAAFGITKLVKARRAKQQ
jgi:hypothetical protein